MQYKYKAILYETPRIVDAMYVPNKTQAELNKPKSVDVFYLNEKSGGNLNFKFSSKALTKLQMYDWPGNISQLINYVEKSLILNQDQNIKELEVDDLALQMGDETASNSSNNSLDLSLKEARSEFEKNYLISQIKRFNGNITKVSEFTGMERTALYRKFKSLDIKVE